MSRKVLRDVLHSATAGAGLDKLAPVPIRNLISVAPIEVAVGLDLAQRVVSVLLSLLLALRSTARSRAALHLEILALRHQLAVVNRSRAQAPSADHRGPRAVGMVVARLERVAAEPAPGRAGDRPRVAPTRVPTVLDVEGSPSRRPSDRHLEHA
jgi:hypothetical protein